MTSCIFFTNLVWLCNKQACRWSWRIFVELGFFYQDCCGTRNGYSTGVVSDLECGHSGHFVVLSGSLRSCASHFGSLAQTAICQWYCRRKSRSKSLQNQDIRGDFLLVKDPTLKRSFKFLRQYRKNKQSLAMMWITRVLVKWYCFRNFRQNL